MIPVEAIKKHGLAQVIKIMLNNAFFRLGEQLYSLPCIVNWGGICDGKAARLEIA